MKKLIDILKSGVCNNSVMMDLLLLRIILSLALNNTVFLWYPRGIGSRVPQRYPKSEDAHVLSTCCWLNPRMQNPWIGRPDYMVTNNMLKNFPDL